MSEKKACDSCRDGHGPARKQGKALTETACPEVDLGAPSKEATYFSFLLPENESEYCHFPNPSPPSFFFFPHKKIGLMQADPAMHKAASLSLHHSFIL